MLSNAGLFEKSLRKSYKSSKKSFVIVDFICPYQEGRKIFGADYLIWMDTVKKGRLSTFNKTFQKPKKFDLKITSKNAKKYSKIIVNNLKDNSKKSFNEKTF